MEAVAGVPGQTGFPPVDAPTRDVQGIAHQGMPGGGQVNAYLVRPAGLDPDLQERAPLSFFQDADSADGRFSDRRGGMDGSQARMCHRPDGNLDDEILAIRDATRQSAVYLGYLPAAQGFTQSGSSPSRASEEHQSRCGTTETMDGSGFGKDLSHQCQERVLQESPAGESGQSTGFRHDQQVLIQVKNSIAEGRGRLFPGGTAPRESLAGFQDGIPFRPPPVEEDLTALQASPPFLFRRVAVCPSQVVQYGQPGLAAIDLFPIFESVIERQ